MYHKGTRVRTRVLEYSSTMVLEYSEYEYTFTIYSSTMVLECSEYEYTLTMYHKGTIAIVHVYHVP